MIVSLMWVTRVFGENRYSGGSVTVTVSPMAAGTTETARRLDELVSNWSVIIWVWLRAVVLRVGVEMLATPETSMCPVLFGPGRKVRLRLSAEIARPLVEKNDASVVSGPVIIRTAVVEVKRSPGAAVAVTVAVSGTVRVSVKAGGGVNVRFIPGAEGAMRTGTTRLPPVPVKVIDPS